MKACGVVVEYNPFHNGHAYHVQKAKEVSHAETVIAVMSGDFLQRGEPAIIDKFHRARAALFSGVDIVLELPYAYAVQNSDYFARGAVHVLHAIGASSICFGSEAGNARPFIAANLVQKERKDEYEKELKERLQQGLSYPEASMHASAAIGLVNNELDLSQPNNILGMGYVKTILEQNLPMNIHTIKRVNNHYHDPEITDSIASATSIRKEIIEQQKLTAEARAALPLITAKELKQYRQTASLWHDWELYFQFVNYRVQTMTLQELRQIHGVTEGLEYRLKSTAKQAENMEEWLNLIKTKRYTWTRIQRLFTHLLTNTKKYELEPFLSEERELPYIRMLGMTEQGQKYLNHVKKAIEIPILSGYRKNMDPLMQLEEKASLSYYSILKPATRKKLFKQELDGPIRIDG
ncbi:nucleotidyltransferase [Oceanobacillus alkalisoli]|uniref:nucleotidyltransferase n=1 Tax=Oceanobacillus alkalisoli TaxID=2925113 RepID=UPI001EF0F8AE|nr:nucleotidyltransferase [Oceanobacillus alkalisoli]MCF3942534.1 nucleotidyltransferase [Oceanobacillus alkalisoli]MCG5103591.1 nucleotidyltransferase [Oceanobacillus alkalisoli]